MTSPRDARSAPALILDGGWGVELQRRGLVLGESADAWNLSRPDEVAAVARSYVEAGADVILTNTFQANPISLARFGLEGRARRINEEGAALSLRAARPAARVFGSIGPTGLGRELASNRDAAAGRVLEAFALQARALADGGVEGVALETFGHVEEARLAVLAARDLRLPVFASFHFDMSSGEPRAADGSSPEEVAAAMMAAGAAAVGANCGAGPGEFVAICRRLRAVAGSGVWIKPNAGLPTMAGGRADYPATPADFAAILPALVEAGAGFVGGCCGAGPDHIRALRRAADEEAPR